MFEWSDGRVCVHLLARSRVWLRSYAAGRGSKSLPPLDMLTETLSRRGAIYMSGAPGWPDSLLIRRSRLHRYGCCATAIFSSCSRGMVLRWLESSENRSSAASRSTIRSASSGSSWMSEEMELSVLNRKCGWTHCELATNCGGACCPFATLEITKAEGMSRRDSAKAVEIIEENQRYLLDRWREIHE